MAANSTLDFWRMGPTSQVVKLITKQQSRFYVVIRINTERYVV